jgi:hypothetical protein
MNHEQDEAQRSPHQGWSDDAGNAGGVRGWHWTPSQSVFFHNAFIGKGLVATSSLVAAAYGNAGFVSPYQVLNRHQDKEDLWEKVRQNIAPNRPSRRGAFFMFEDRDTANRAGQCWFSNEDRIAIRAVALSPLQAIVHRADTEWLNRPEREWEDAAKCYWQGVASATPLFELLVHGMVYFPDWQNPPFGPLTP